MAVVLESADEEGLLLGEDENICQRPRQLAQQLEVYLRLGERVLGCSQFGHHPCDDRVSEHFFDLEVFEGYLVSTRFFRHLLQ